MEKSIGLKKKKQQKTNKNQKKQQKIRVKYIAFMKKVVYNNAKRKERRKTHGTLYLQ